MTAISIKLDIEAEKILYILKEHGINYSDFIRQALKEKYEREKLFIVYDAQKKEEPKEEWQKFVSDIDKKLSSMQEA